MAEKSNIEWTDATWNPITGCTMASAGCTNCYAMGLAATRLRDHPSRAGLTRVTGGRPVWTGEVRLNEGWLHQPLRWRRPRLIFVCAHGDLFHEAVPDDWIDRVFAVMALARRHTFQVLTKRPERARAYFEGRRAAFGRASDRLHEMEHSLSEDEAQDAADLLDLSDSMGKPLPNVWLGTSVEGQATADARIPHLLATSAAVRFLSAEPLLGPVDLNGISAPDCGIYALTGVRSDGSGPSGFSQGPRLDWVIVGGESGPGARPMHPEWARSLRDQCRAAGVAFFFKQWGEWAPERPARPEDLVDARKFLIVRQDGGTTSGLMAYGDDAWLVHRWGKRAAGRLLDGREWSELPVRAG